MTPWLPLETERLLLRDFRLEDEVDIYEYASDAEVQRFADRGASDVSTVRANVQGRIEDQERWPRKSIEVAVELRTDSCLIGIMRITVLDDINRTADLDTLSIDATRTTATRLKVHRSFCDSPSQI